MTKQVVVQAGVLCLAAALLAASDEPNDANWQTLVDGTYKFVLHCPAELMPTPDYKIAAAKARYNPRAFSFTVEGGESNTAQQFSSLYQLHNPSKYAIQGQMNLPAELGSGLANSNTLTLTVIASQEGEPHPSRPDTQ
jgi:hypothetical protein